MQRISCTSIKAAAFERQQPQQASPCCLPRSQKSLPLLTSSTSCDEVPFKAFSIMICRSVGVVTFLL